jgi:UDP-N-acetylmuramoyl-L-alanyl-D-glutamate--2,6-diaminopimelate ligase
MTDFNTKTLKSARHGQIARNRLADCRAVGSAMLLQRTVQRRHMTQTLRKLITGLPGLEVQGKDSVTVNSMATDSRRVGPGSVFFAMPGLRTDGQYFIEEAIDRGARVVVSQKECWVPPQVTLVVTKDIRTTVGAMSARFYGNPEKALELTGFIGTSGKTVVSALLKHFYDPSGPVGLMGTIHYSVGNRTLPAHRTTPEPIELYGLLSQMREQGCARALLEVSSHGIDQERVGGLKFHTLALLNLTPEHLNYHGSLENYIELEKNFITQQGRHLKHFVAGIDDRGVQQVMACIPQALKKKLISYGLSPDATIRAEDVRFSDRNTRFKLVWPEGEINVVSPLLGEFNLQNVLAAIACGYAEGLDPIQMGAALISFEGVRGRMERLEINRAYNVLVDYMHTEAAYEKGLAMVRGITKGRLITIFGCGGNRDASTRPVITSIVASKSDVAIATADNPRNETVESIFSDMLKGNENAGNLQVVADRRAAIAKAIELAEPGDTILIAGKGHETFQEFGECVVPFDDRAVAREIILNKQWHKH